MQTLTKTIKKNVALIVFGTVCSMLNPVWAESDMQLQEKALKARERVHKDGEDHSGHDMSKTASGGFRGVFYGYLPCHEEECSGLKMTLSLKPRNNYLLVTQPAKPASREFFDKGKYEWNDDTRLLTLNSSKNGSTRQFRIENEGALVTLDENGAPMPGDQDAYTLRRSDKTKIRDAHFH
ncbi:MAG: copper resistance protein NlpE N-terminal domain-containing protein [Methylomonas sp.]|nr:copper resistance protein NlpE N-terminal domain-containing protein [Methylomonas sp.]PPD21983.1 MAG: copper homeostasis protein [Methylomonas sp.]PPD25560.1 MAG: copper homeostasis protein [Methylomonas sp.]PPD36470.1 MAG: copper homeostasis protein [Methylomonas sp.]PPD39507.1 MAG: copper homeostasis protein [Methylomonas sp.]